MFNKYTSIFSVKENVFGFIKNVLMEDLFMLARHFVQVLNVVYLRLRRPT